MKEDGNKYVCMLRVRENPRESHTRVPTLPLIHSLCLMSLVPYCHPNVLVPHTTFFLPFFITIYYVVDITCTPSHLLIFLLFFFIVLIIVICNSFYFIFFIFLFRLLFLFFLFSLYMYTHESTQHIFYAP